MLNIPKFNFFELMSSKDNLAFGFSKKLFSYDTESCGLNLIKDHKKSFIYTKKASIVILLIIIILHPELSYAQNDGGGYAESYLQRNIGARAVSLAGAFTAVSNDPMTIFYNPAGLGFLSQRAMIASSYSFLDFGRTHTALAWGQSFNDDYGIGFGINNFTTGSFVARDVRGNPIGKFTDWQFALNAGGSYSIEFATLGVGLKYLANSLERSGSRADGFAIDLGSKFNIMDIFTFALSVQNISAMMFWNNKSGESNLIPYTIRSGLAMEFGINEQTNYTRTSISGELITTTEPATRYVLVSLDAVLNQHEYAPTLTLGIEVVPDEVIAFRAGIAIAGDNMGKFQMFPMTVWGSGVSIRPVFTDLPYKTHIDYSVSGDPLASYKIAHHISLMFEF